MRQKYTQTLGQTILVTMHWIVELADPDCHIEITYQVSVKSITHHSFVCGRINFPIEHESNLYGCHLQCRVVTIGRASWWSRDQLLRM